MTTGESATVREVSLADNTIDHEETEAVVAVLRSRWLSADHVTRAFEDEFAAAHRAPDAVFVSSGTAALHLAVLALGLRAGDEIIVPSLTFVASAAVAALHGIVPVFADVTSGNHPLIDPAEVERLIGPRTRAVVVTHYAGYPAASQTILSIARARGLAVIEDAAHAPAVETPLGMLGTLGDVGCFSLFSTKNLTSGEGGVVLARDPVLLDRIRLLRSHHIGGSSRSRADGWDTYDITGVGLNYRPTEMAAAMARVQLTKLPRDRRVRGELVGFYRERLASVAVDLPFVGHRGDSAHHLLPVLLPDGADRAGIRARLRADGVQTSVHYPPTHLLAYYRDDPDGLRHDVVARERLPVTERIAGRLLTLPLHSRMSADDVEHVAARLQHALVAAE